MADQDGEKSVKSSCDTADPASYLQNYLLCFKRSCTLGFIISWVQSSCVKHASCHQRLSCQLCTLH